MYEDQLNNGRASINDTQTATKESPLMSLMRDYVAAKSDFDKACESFSQTQQRRANAEKRLHELSEKVAQAVAEGVYDPTCPKPSQPTNSVIGGQMQQSRY